MQHLRSAGKTVAVTATTGLASLQFRDLGGSTIHRWAGINGRFTKEQLSNYIDTNEAYIQAKQRIHDADVLIIDEISMLSRKVFETLEHIVRKIKCTDSIFGGLQVLVSGCFKQLAPVPDPMQCDLGEYCFQSEQFQQTFPHRINLVTVKRQNEDDLIHAVQELCDGQPSPDTEDLIKELQRPVDTSTKPVYLYGTVFEVDLHNHDELDLAPGVATRFKSIDTGVYFFQLLGALRRLFL